MAVLIPTLKVWISLLSHNKFPKHSESCYLGLSAGIYPFFPKPHALAGASQDCPGTGLHGSGASAAAYHPLSPRPWSLLPSVSPPENRLSTPSSLAAPHSPDKTFPKALSLLLLYRGFAFLGTFCAASH